MMNMYFGIVEDRDDPDRLGRVRVRCFGIHTASKIDIPTESLPWATVMQPTTSAASSGVGLSPNIVEGAQVVVMFIDGEDMQFPIILGTVPGYNTTGLTSVDGVERERDTTSGFQDPTGQFPKEEYISDVDTAKAARGNFEEFPRTQHTSTNPLFDIVEPADTRHNSEYPFNNVRQTEAGHIEEWDNTPGFERISTTHANGSFTEMRHDGDKVEKIVNDRYTIIAQGDNVYIGGVCNLHINNTCNTYIDGNYNLTVTGNHNVFVEGNLNEFVSGDVNETYEQNQNTSVDGNVTETYMSDQTINVQGDITESASTIDNTYRTKTEVSSTGNVIYNSGEITVRGITHTKHRHTDTPGLSAGTTSGPRG